MRLFTSYLMNQFPHASDNPINDTKNIFENLPRYFKARLVYHVRVSVISEERKLITGVIDTGCKLVTRFCRHWQLSVLSVFYKRNCKANRLYSRQCHLLFVLEAQGYF